MQGQIGKYGLHWIAARLMNLTCNRKVQTLPIGPGFSVTSFREDGGLLWIASGYRSRNVILFDKTKEEYSLISNNPLTQIVFQIAVTFCEDRSGASIGLAKQGYVNLSGRTDV
jgi:hypothetical protein